MEIVLEVAQSADGHLSGTARLAADAEQMVFTGAMELVACIEALCNPGADGKEIGQ